MIKAIVFDCFGVLTTDKWKAFMSTLPVDQKTPAHNINHEYDGGHITKAMFIARIKELTGRDPGEVEAARNGDLTRNVELLHYIAKLKQNYKIGLLSNIATNWVRERFLSAEEQALFDEMIFSFEVGVTKPDHRIFELACQRLGVETDEAIMVDDIEAYCDAAQQTGMQAIVYSDFAQMKAELEKMLKL
jgi:epoxide hydrolase-like predicted phosphatase